MRRLHRACRRRRRAFLRHPDFLGWQRQGGHPGRARHAGEAAPGADRLHPGAGLPMRLLPQWLGGDDGGDAEGEEKSDRQRNSPRAFRPEMPLRHAHVDPARGQARRDDDGLRESTMTKMEKIQLTRRSVVQGAGMFVFSIGIPVGLDTMLNINAALAQGGKPALVPTELDSYLAINADGTVNVYFGKIDGGQGVDVAIGQMVAEELDVPVKSVKVIMGDTAVTLNQGGASGSNGVQRGGMQMRYAAAEARHVLLQAAAEKLNVPAEKLVVNDGLITVTGDATKKISYADLIGGRFFNVRLEWNGKLGNDLEAHGKAKPKSPDQYKIVGQSFPRSDLADKLYGQYEYVTDVKLPGMVH